MANSSVIKMVVIDRTLPRDYIELCHFLAMVMQVERHARIVMPTKELRMLVGRDQWQWTTSCQMAFDLIMIYLESIMHK